jgi:hypothetical protein
MRSLKTSYAWMESSHNSQISMLLLLNYTKIDRKSAKRLIVKTILPDIFMSMSQIDLCFY